ncbi:MAG: SH3 domain-containing protein, partial [Pseudomonadota bacterium]
MNKNKSLLVSFLSISSLIIQQPVSAFSMFDAISNSVQSTIGSSLTSNPEPADQQNKTYQKQVTKSELTGVAKKNANVRSIPNQSGKKVGRLSKGSDVNIIKTQG